MTALLENKTAVITGGSEGIGFGIARTFVANGADVLLIGRDRDKLQHARESLDAYKRSVNILVGDLARPDKIDGICDEIGSLVSNVDILVNNAGVARFVAYEQVDEALLDLHLNLNIKAPYLLTRALLPSLKAVKGNVINISSYFSDRMLPDRPSTAYSLTKGAMDSFTKAMAFETGPAGVRVNAISPGTVNTPMVQANIDRLDEQQRQRFSEMIASIYPLQRTGEPEDIGHAAVYLASDLARWVTGSIFHIDGGLTTN